MGKMGISWYSNLSSRQGINASRILKIFLCFCASFLFCWQKMWCEEPAIIVKIHRIRVLFPTRRPMSMFLKINRSDLGSESYSNMCARMCVRIYRGRVLSFFPLLSVAVSWRCVYGTIDYLTRIRSIYDYVLCIYGNVYGLFYLYR